jgi:hypothetical protein
VVPEHGERRSEAAQQAAEQRLAVRPREQVAGDADEVGPAFPDPRDRALHGDGSARGDAEVEVGQVRDAKPVELRRQALDRHVEHTRAQPTGLEPAVGQAGRTGHERQEQETVRR